MSSRRTSLIVGAVLLGASLAAGGAVAASQLMATRPAAADGDVAVDLDEAVQRQLMTNETHGSDANGISDARFDDTEPLAPQPATAAELVAENGAGDIELEAPLILDGEAGAVIDAVGLDVTFESDGSVASVVPGPGTLPLPSFGPLADATATLFEGTVGYASGEEIAHLGAHTRADTNYWYVVLEEETSLDTGLPFMDQFPVSYDIPGGGSSVVVFDPIDPYLYISFPCGLLSDEKRDNENADNKNDDQNGSSAPESTDVPLTVSISGYQGGGCGVGFSGQGRIPFVASVVDGIPEAFTQLEANVVIDGEVPLSTTTEVVGSIYIDVDADGFALAADGEVTVSATMVPDKLDLSIPMGRGSVAYEYRGSHEDLWFAGTTGTSLLEDGTLDLFVEFAPFENEMTISGRLRHEADASGKSVLTSDSFLQVEGSASLGIDAIADAVGVDVEPFQQVDMFARIDQVGIVLQGTTSFSPIPGLDVGGESSIDLFVPFADPAASYVQVDGQFIVGGVDLGTEASLRIDRNGIVAAGSMTTPVSTVEMAGSVGPDGIQLTGRTEIVIAVPDFGEYAEQLAREAGVEGTISRIERRIDARIDEIGATDPTRAAVLRGTISEMRSVRADITQIQGKIDANDREIARIDRALAKAKRDWDGYTVGERVLYSVPHGARVSALNVEREGYETAKNLQIGYRAAANLTLTGLEQTIVGAVGQDSELWRLEGMATELRANAFSATFLSLLSQGVDDMLTTFGVTGEFRGTVEFSVGTEGLSGLVDVSKCQDGSCTTLAGGSITFPDFQTCITVVGIEACTIA